MNDNQHLVLVRNHNQSDDVVFALNRLVEELQILCSKAEQLLRLREGAEG